MVMKRRLFAAGATLLTAAVVGHLVQNGESLYAQMTSQKVVTQPAVTAAVALETATIKQLAASVDDTPPAADPAALPALPQDVASQPGPARVEGDLPLRVAGLDSGYAQPVDTEAGFDEYGLQCATDLSATPAQAGMVTLALSAPCKPNAWVSVFHDAMRFTLQTDSQGGLKVAVPALTTDAAFMVLYADGTALNAVAQVPAAEDYTHVVLQWQGRNAMQIHAFAAEADYGDAGHVWAGAPGTPEGDAGFMTVLGDATLPEAQVAEIYSVPHTANAPRVSVEAEVTAANCGREISAETLQRNDAGVMHPAEVTFYMPGCDATGEFLVLKNLPQDMKIARN